MSSARSTDGIVGTPTYMAPERFGGGSGTERSDVYSLGVMLYEMLSGQRPFDRDGDLFKLIVLHMNERPRPLSELRPELPPAIGRVILQALSKEAAERPSAVELGRRLLGALSHEEPIVLG